MRRICLDLEYEGTRYHGWQVQTNAVTVQAVLEEALFRILEERTRVIGAGRTDAGVHAWGQVAHFNTDKAIENQALLRAMNSLLPADIAVRAVTEPSPAFHARRSALKKRYEYWVRNDSLPSVFSRRFEWHLKRPLDIEGMRRAAVCLVGRHDFSSFQASGSRAGTDPVRNLGLLDIESCGDGRVRFAVEGDSFLRHMVRILVGTLVEVGLGRIREQEVCEILAARDRQRAGATAPAQGLFLKWVRYPADLKVTLERGRSQPGRNAAVATGIMAGEEGDGCPGGSRFDNIAGGR
jgi:tRNA pseudouridine38-40 synthase